MWKLPPRCFGESIAGQCVKQRQQRDVSNFGWKLETPLSKSPCNLIYFRTSLMTTMTTRSPGDLAKCKHDKCARYPWCPCSRRVPDCEVEKISPGVQGVDNSFQLDCYSEKSNQMSNEKKGPKPLFRVYRGWNPTQLCGDYEIKPVDIPLYLFVNRDPYNGLSIIPT